MECLHRYIGEYLGLNRNEIGHFQEDLMPIGNYEIVRVVQPSDIAQGYCLKEFIANRYEDYHNERVGYSIIRQYRRVGKDKEEFVRRASDVYLAGDNCGSLLKQVTILSTKDSQYYIVAYDFRTSAQPINQTFLKSLLITEKLQLCLSYAEILNAFHNNSTPIYHRMLTSKCAYYTDERKNGRGISTAIIKFEFAKIEDPTIGTIFSYTREQQRRLSAEERRFLPIGSSNHWNQMDIYSLSVLFCDILMEQIGNYQITSMRQNPNIQLCANILGKMSQFEYDNISGVCSDLRALIKKTNE